jgi:hypothetical protein
MLLAIFKDGLKSGHKYFVFPTGGDKNLKPFVTDGEFMIIDDITAQYLVDVFKV